MKAETIKSTAPRIQSLRDKANKDECFNAVMHRFSQRERARGQVTLRHLTKTMHKEGFTFTSQDYGKVLKTLADLGFGMIQNNRNGTIFGLVGIKVTLQSLGKAALTNDDALEKFAPSTTYATVPMPKAQTPAQRMAEAPMIAPVQMPIERFQAEITVHINGQPVAFPIKSGLTVAQLSDLMGELAFAKTSKEVQQ